jgi:hypothetical protein
MAGAHATDAFAASAAVPAIRVQQWLPEWDDVPFDALRHRGRPEPCFYAFALPAAILKRLTGVHKREARLPERRGKELSTQRLHQPDRSREIAEFVRFGFPWSELSERQREDEHPDLRKPGWLPTTVLVNILGRDDVRGGGSVHPDDLVRIEQREGALAAIHLPPVGRGWRPTGGGVHPFEVIDGQHRLWAFEERDVPDSFELPVVAFHGLDRSWQAYLFWSINIKPKRINASLAYDLYPLLRGEEWLERFSGPFVYRETRAQELVEVLWAHPRSPWRGRINMLGEPGSGQVRQAAWVRSLVATFVRAAEGPRVRIGGLFGARPREHQPAVPWTRAQQAAFLLSAWARLAEAIQERRPEWALGLRGRPGEPLMFAPDSLLNTDQGVRAFLSVLNDLTVVRHEPLRLDAWEVDELGDGGDHQDVTRALEALPAHPAIDAHLRALAGAAASFDWRTANAAGLGAAQRTLRLTFRGSGGYSQLRRHVLRHLAAAPGSPEIAGAAAHVLEVLAP